MIDNAETDTGHEIKTTTTSTTATQQQESFLSENTPPMGIYETLYAFCDSYGQFMGTEGTHAWSQGFPLTTPLEKFDGPPLPSRYSTST